MNASEQNVLRDIEKALDRAAERAKRTAQASESLLVRNIDGKIVKSRVEADGTETVVGQDVT